MLLNMLGAKERPGPNGPGQSLLKFTAVSTETLRCHYLWTVRVTLVVFVLPPPVPVMVMVWDPVLAREVVVTFIVDVPEPGAGMDAGLKLTVTPEGWPVSDKVIGQLKPFSAAVVIVEVPELPLTTVIAVGDALMVKLALA